MYAIMYPDRAARIRVARGLPAKLDFAWRQVAGAIGPAGRDAHLRK